MPEDWREWKDFELVGEAGRKNGAKILRSLIIKTKLWKSVEERRLAVRTEKIA